MLLLQISLLLYLKPKMLDADLRSAPALLSHSWPEETLSNMKAARMTKSEQAVRFDQLPARCIYRQQQSTNVLSQLSADNYKKSLQLPINLCPEICGAMNKYSLKYQLYSTDF